jgi:prepilin-type N-terminal cleavage/methylation domain-containing protein
MKGFTLLETLISISVIAVVGVLISQVFFTTTRSNTKTELLKDVKQNGQYALEIVSRMIRNSLSVETTCDGAERTSIDIKNQDGFISTIGCVFDNSVTRIASTSAVVGATSQFLSSQNVTMGGVNCSNSTFILTCSALPDQAPKITISFRMSQKGTPVDQFEKASVLFQTTVSPRF